MRNAVQASGAGAEVRVIVRADARGVDLSVEDQGPGIAESAREKIFDAFFTTRAGGSGMGLAVVKRIIDDHAPFGASIAVESPPRGGDLLRSACDDGVRGGPDTAGAARSPVAARPECGTSRRSFEGKTRGSGAVA